MRIRCVIFLMIMFMLFHIAEAQDSVRYSTLSLSGGVNAILSEGFKYPGQYSGTNFSINSTYTRFQKSGQHIVEFAYTSGNIQATGYPDAKTRLTFLNYDYLFNIGSAKKKLVPSLGVGIHGIMNHIDYLPGFQSSERYFTSNAAFVTLSGNLSYRLGKRSTIKLQAGIPVFGVVSRSGNTLGGKSSTSVVFVNESVLFSAKIEYCYQLTSKLGLIASYRYDYFDDSAVRPYRVVSNGLFIGLRVRL